MELVRPTVICIGGVGLACGPSNAARVETAAARGLELDSGNTPVAKMGETVTRAPNSR